MIAEWKKYPEEKPGNTYDNLFLVNPEEGVTIGYYDWVNDNFREASNERIYAQITYWMPIEYPKAPEGSIDTDWD